MQFRILGPLQVVDSGRPVNPGAPKQRALLALLLIHANEVLSPDRILDELWPEGPPRGGTQTLQVHVAKLRKALGGGTAGPLRTTDAGYVVEVAPDDLDSLRFERIWRGAMRDIDTNPARASAELRRALGLWRGPALVDFRYDDFAAAETHRLELLRLSATEDLFAADLALGRHTEILDRIEEAADENPLRERFQEQRMIALYRLGRQADALRAYADLRRLLGEELGIEPPPRLQDLETRILLHDTSLLATPRPEPASAALPTRLTSFIGRWKDQAGVDAMLREHRLVTINGVGGVGKTSLAVELARDSTVNYPDGTWMVRLASLSDSTLVGSEVAAALGLEADRSRDVAAQLVGHLADRRGLLVLDNCEHLVDAVAGLVEALLQHCAELRVLATSRSPLGVDGEAVFSLAPLAIPPSDAKPSELANAPAVRLLIERAALRRPGFAIGDDNASALGTICRRLAGIPLAIELAAARLATIPLDDFVEHLDDQFSVLTAGTQTAEPRQRTLEATMEWSYRLLRPEEQRVMARIAVFRDAFSLEAAQAVAADEAIPEARVADSLGRLGDASLLTVAPDGKPAPYEMLEPVRQYGLRALATSGEQEAVRLRHARHFAERAAELVVHHETERWTRVIETGAAIIGDCRAALTWALESGRTSLALDLASSLSSYWDLAGATQEGLATLKRALTMASRQPTKERFVALENCVVFAIGSGEAADPWLDELDEWANQASASEVVSRATRSHGLLAYAHGDLRAALELLDSAYEQSVRDGEQVRQGPLHAEILIRLGRLDEADRLIDDLDRRESALEEYSNHGIVTARAMAAFCRGDLAAAETEMERAVKGFGQQGSLVGQREAMMYLAWVTLDLGQERRTRLLLESSLALSRSYAGVMYEGTNLWLLARFALQRGEIAAAREHLAAATDVACRRRETVSLMFDLFVWADLAHAEGASLRSARLFGAAERAREDLHHIMPPTIGKRYESIQADLRRLLGDERYLVAVTEGAELTLNDAVTLATTQEQIQNG
jgi:predicted ATPase/DNA-binding SARP family transcriptional activator